MSSVWRAICEQVSPRLLRDVSKDENSLVGCVFAAKPSVLNGLKNVCRDACLIGIQSIAFSFIDEIIKQELSKVTLCAAG